MKRMIFAGLLTCSMFAAVPGSAAAVDWVRSATHGGDIYSWSNPEVWEVGIGGGATTGWAGGILPLAGDNVAFHLSYPANWDGPIATTVNYDVPTPIVNGVSTPIAFNSVTISNYDITPVILSLNNGYAFSTNNLTVGPRGTLALHGGTLTTTNERIDDRGYVLQTSGVNAISDTLFLVQGTYELRGGALGARNERIGGFGGNPGEFLQTGGLNTVGYELSLSDGTYSLRGGSLEAFNETIGDSDAGVFNQIGGTHDVTGNLTIGDRAHGRYDLSAGTLDGGFVRIGQNALGIFNQSGGTNDSGNIVIGYSVSSNGSSYYLSDGTLRAGTLIVGNSGTGIFGQTGGISRLGELTVGNTSEGLGTYTLNGTGSPGFTSLTAELEFIGFTGTGVFNQVSSNDGVNTVRKLYLGVNEGGHGTYNMSGHVLLAAGDLVVGSGGYGSFTQNRGTNRIGAVTLEPGGAQVGTGTLTLGELLGGSGVYSMNPFDSALPELRASTEVIGNYGTGTFTQYGGTNTVAGDLYLGRFAGGSGSYALSGASGAPPVFIPGFPTPPSPPPTVLLAVNEYIGDGGTGAFTQTGGGNTLSGSLFLGGNNLGSNGSGTYALGGGSLWAANEYVGSGGTGILDQSGGTNFVNGGLHVGGSGAGTYNLSGGQLYAADMWIGAGAGTGTFNQSGGSNNVGNLLTVGSNGTYTLSDTFGPGSPATLNTGGILNNGTFNYSGGVLSIFRPSMGPPPYPPDPDFTNNGTLNISGTRGQSFRSTVINNGTVKTTETTVTFVGDFINNGAYISDPSTNIFSNLTVGTRGYLVGALGDAFQINGKLIVTSLMNTEWNTSGALLEFSSGIHELDLSGSTVDLRFATLQIDAGGYFSDGSEGTISADVLNIYGLSDFLSNFNGSDLRINYGSLFAFDFDVDGNQYLVNGSQLNLLESLGFTQTPVGQAPVPEPSTMLLLGSGLAGLVGYGRRRFKK